MDTDPYATPQSNLESPLSDVPRYAGFWRRFFSYLIDSILQLLVLYPVLTAVYGWENIGPARSDLTPGGGELFLTYVIPAVVIIAFWIYKSATPGKMLLGMQIVDAKTGLKPSSKQFIGRYLAYFVSMLPLFLGFIWVAFDNRKQGWHDKLSGTVVVRTR